MGENENITLGELLKEIQRNRSEIKNAIEALDSRLLLETEYLKSKNQELERENQILKEEIEQLRRESVKNSIVIFGSEIVKKKSTVEDICALINDLVEVDVKPSEINNFYTLGNNTNVPLKIDFANYWKKTEVLRNSYKLKGRKDINISPALTGRQRVEGKVLRKHLFLARQDKQENCYIKGNKLYVQNQIYTVEELLKLEDSGDKRKINSAPSTPTLEAPTRIKAVNGEELKRRKNSSGIEEKVVRNSPKVLSKPLTRLQDVKSRNNSTSKK